MSGQRDGAEDTQSTVQSTFCFPFGLICGCCKHYSEAGRLFILCSFTELDALRKWSCRDVTLASKTFPLIWARSFGQKEMCMKLGEPDFLFSQDKSCCHVLSWATWWFFTKLWNIFIVFHRRNNIFYLHKLILLIQKIHYLISKISKLFLHHLKLSERSHLRQNKPCRVTSEKPIFILLANRCQVTIFYPCKGGIYWNIWTF